MVLPFVKEDGSKALEENYAREAMNPTVKLLAAPIGLLINFHELTLKKGIYRMILPGAQP